jgi:hypothetical protein
LVLSGVISQNSSVQDLGHAISGVGAILLTCLVGMFVVYALLLSIIRPIIVVIFSRDGTFASCFRLGEVFRILTRHPGPFFTAWIIVILAGMVIGLIVGFINMILGWIPCLGWMVGLLIGLGSAMYILTTDAHLFGQFRIATLGMAEFHTHLEST